MQCFKKLVEDNQQAKHKIELYGFGLVEFMIEFHESDDILNPDHTWEVTADIYGGVQSNQSSPEYIGRGEKYLNAVKELN